MWLLLCLIQSMRLHDFLVKIHQAETVESGSSFLRVQNVEKLVLRLQNIPKWRNIWQISGNNDSKTEMLDLILKDMMLYLKEYFSV